MDSLWKDSVTLPSFEQCKGHKKTDVLIIGGGLCGLLCAHMLQNRGVDCMVVEANTIASGTTGNTTGKITALQGLIYHKLWKSKGKEMAQMYLAANLDALEQYRSLARRFDFDFKIQSAYTYSLENEQRIAQEVTALQNLGADAHFSACPDLPFDPVGAVRLDGQAQMHPLKLIKKLLAGLKIYEHSPVTQVTLNGAQLPGATVTAKKIIVATHFPFINRHGAYFLKLYQHRSYVLALKNAARLDGMYVDEDTQGLSFRRWGDLLLLGGGGHRTGEQGGGWKQLQRLAHRFYPDATVVYQWATQDCMSLDGLPYIGQYARHTSDVLVASGFHKWGMTGSMVAAKLLADQITDKQNDFTELFSPARSIWHKQLFINGAQSAIHLLTPSLRRCSHLGCALKWNRAEHTWDCPCHGSRFTADGTLINNPATHDANIKKQ